MSCFKRSYAKSYTVDDDGITPFQFTEHSNITRRTNIYQLKTTTNKTLNYKYTCFAVT